MYYEKLFSGISTIIYTSHWYHSSFLWGSVGKGKIHKLASINKTQNPNHDSDHPRDNWRNGFQSWKHRSLTSLATWQSLWKIYGVSLNLSRSLVCLTQTLTLMGNMETKNKLEKKETKFQHHFFPIFVQIGNENIHKTLSRQV